MMRCDCCDRMVACVVIVDAYRCSSGIETAACCRCRGNDECETCNGDALPMLGCGPDPDRAGACGSHASGRERSKEVAVSAIYPATVAVEASDGTVYYAPVVDDGRGGDPIAPECGGSHRGHDPRDVGSGLVK